MSNMNWKNLIFGYLVSLVMGLAVTTAVAMVFALLIGQEALGENVLGYGAMAAVLVGSFVAGIVSSLKVDLPKLAATAGAAVFFWLGLMLCGWVFFGKVSTGVLPTGAICLAGALPVGLMGRKGNGKPKFKVPKMRF